MALDPSEMDRIVSLTKVPLPRLVDWKNGAGTAFELRCSGFQEGACKIALNVADGLTVPLAIPVVHGEYESRKEEDGTLVYTGKPGNTMGQATTPDGRAAFAVAYDLTELDPQGRPIFKIYFGTAASWFVKNAYHQKWNDLRDVRAELDPTATPAPVSTDDRVGKERAQNPRSRQRAEEREQRHDSGGGGRGRGSRGGGSRGRGGGGGGGGGGRGRGGGGSRGGGSD